MRYKKQTLLLSILPKIIQSNCHVKVKAYFHLMEQIIKVTLSSFEEIP